MEHALSAHSTPRITKHTRIRSAKLFSQIIGWGVASRLLCRCRWQGAAVTRDSLDATTVAPVYIGVTIAAYIASATFVPATLRTVWAHARTVRVCGRYCRHLHYFMSFCLTGRCTVDFHCSLSLLSCITGSAEYPLVDQAVRLTPFVLVD